MTVPAPQPMPGQVFGRYRIESVLGQGGMGVVYLATDPQLKRKVALKVVASTMTNSADYVRRFEREAEAMARVSSPNIVQIHDYGTDDGRPFLVSQYVAGGDLAGRIARGALPPQQAVAITVQVADALSAAHRAGVVHRDVKPANVLVDDADGRMHAYLCDFGIAQPEGYDGLTQTGGITGSWSYLSPERLQGEPATPASDIYAAGCLLWTCLTGRPPYQGTEAQVAMAHINDPVPQLHGADPTTRHLNGVLARALAKNPAQRFGSAAEFRDALTMPAPGPQAGPTVAHAASAPPRRPQLPPTPASPAGLLVGLIPLSVLLLYDVVVALSVRWRREFGGIHVDDQLVRIFPPLLVIGLGMAVLAVVMLLRRRTGAVAVAAITALYHVAGFTANLVMHQTVPETTYGVVEHLGRSPIFLTLSVVFPIVVFVLVLQPAVRRAALPTH